MLELLKGLPVRIENRVRSELQKLTWRQPLKWLFNFFALVFIASVIAGIIEGESFIFWRGSIVPWLLTEQTGIINGYLLATGLACLTSLCGILFFWLLAFLFYGADRRRLGQLEVVGRENAQRGQEIQELNTEIGRLGNELQYAQQSRVHLLTMFGALDRELLMLYNQNSIDNKIAVGAFFESACRRLFSYFSQDSDVFRACIYLPDETDPDFLVITWDYGVGEVSRRWNRWYIGNQDPHALGTHRGIPGMVFTDKDHTGRVNENVRDDPDFYDPHQPTRIVLPYQAILHAVIHPDDPDKRFGVLCIDSLTYKFADKDLEIGQQVAIRLGWLLYRSKQISLQVF